MIADSVLCNQCSVLGDFCFCFFRDPKVLKARVPEIDSTCGFQRLAQVYRAALAQFAPEVRRTIWKVRDEDDESCCQDVCNYSK
jgi:hypothetical protein